jgi:hypothetical protein
MSTNEHEECEDRMVDLMSNFSMGLGLLMVLADHNAATGSREETLETFAAFEAAYGPLAAQKDRRLELSTGKRRAPVLLSGETFERVKQLGALLRLPPESTEPEGAAAEIRSLAEECLRRLAPEAAPSSEPSEPT